MAHAAAEAAGERGSVELSPLGPLTTLAPKSLPQIPLGAEGPHNILLIRVMSIILPIKPIASELLGYNTDQILFSYICLRIKHISRLAGHSCPDVIRVDRRDIIIVTNTYYILPRS